MDSLWNDDEAKHFKNDLALRAYTSRLLGGDQSLVMFGGGNTSVKFLENGEEVLYVKGSGADLAHVTEKDFSPVRLAEVRPLIERDTMSNAEMAANFRSALINPEAPRPSIETLLHGFLPCKWVEHTHADAILAVANTTHGENHLRAAFGDTVIGVPYRHSGFGLAKTCHDVFTRLATHNTIGMVLLQHGIFAFGDNARESYERMIALVTRAEDYLKSKDAWDIPLRFPSVVPAGTFPQTDSIQALAALRRDISHTAGFPLVMTLSSDLMSLAFSRRPDLKSLSQREPATPQHAVFTKRVPMLGRDVNAYAADYRGYLAEHAPERQEHLPDTAPRIALDPEWGFVAAGITPFYADAAAEIYRHSIKIQSRAEALEAYASLPPREVLAAEIEYGGFEKTIRDQYELAGQVVLVDQAIQHLSEVDKLLAKGAAVIGLDSDPRVMTLHTQPEYLGLLCHSDSHAEIKVALEQSVRRFGGIDSLISGNPLLAATCVPLLALSPLRKTA